MSDWLWRMFDPAGFPARWHCGEWSSFLGWLHIGSDVAIWLAYMGIPAVLLFFVRRRRDLPFLPVFWLFMVFIASCGIGHLVEASMFWWPAYRFSGAVKAVTAIASVATLVALFPFARRALAMPGTRQLLAKLRDEASAHHLSQEHLRLATMASGVGLWNWRSAEDRLTWDANTGAIFGLGPDDRTGNRDTLRELVHAGDQTMLTAALQGSIERGEPLAATFRIVRRDGTTAHVVARGSPIRDPDGRITGLAGAFFDVTKEEVSRGLFRIAVEASPNALLMVARDGTIVLANSQTEAVFGYSRGELLGRTVDRLVPRIVEPHHAALRESFFAAPTHRRLGAGRDLCGLRKNGSEVPLEIALAPVQLLEGPGVLAAIVDISERTAMHAKLSQAERLAAIGELAAGVAHEINNPINTIINCAQLVHDGDPIADNCKTIVEEGMRIAAIVKDLLQFARDDRASPQPTSLADVVGRCIRLIGANLTRHGVLVHLDVPEELPPVHAHPQQLQQVLLNLLINAKDALSAEHTHTARRIDVVARPLPGDRVRCSVRDNGPGVPPDQRERIFEPFVTTKRARGGTGLGLSVSRSIVASFGGTLDVDSVLGEFAEFTFVLPVATAEDRDGGGDRRGQSDETRSPR